MTYSSASEAPDKFHFWTGVSTLAGALRRRVWIPQNYFDWTANFYIILVAPPGIVSKSTTISIGINLLKEIDDIIFGPDAVTWQALAQSLASSTREVLWENEYHAMSCITIASSEFGTFMNPHDREMVDVMVSLWDGQIGVWTKSTKTQGDDQIINPWLNMIACTTPAWIAGNFPEYLIGGGFTSRCILVYAEEKRHLIAYPGLATPKNFQSLRSSLIHDLEEISQLMGPVELTPKAIAWGERWYEQHYESIKEGRFDQQRFGGYMARKQTHLHKTAMVLALAKHNELYIDEGDLERSLKLINDLESDMPKVFGMIGRSNQARLTDEVYRVINSAGAIDRPLVFKELRSILGATEIEEGLRGCVQAGLVSIFQKNGRVILVSEEFRLKAQGAGSSETEGEKVSRTLP
jgi:hypothetical protein